MARGDASTPVAMHPSHLEPFSLCILERACVAAHVPPHKHMHSCSSNRAVRASAGVISSSFAVAHTQCMPVHPYALIPRL